VSFRRCDWLFPPSAREVSPGNRSNYKSTRERVDSKGLYGRWRLHLMGSWLIIVGFEFRVKIYISCQKEWKCHLHMPPENTYFEILYFSVQLFLHIKTFSFQLRLSNRFNKNEVGLPVVSASGKFVWYPDLPVLSCHRSDMMNLCDSICLVYGVLK